MLEQPADQHDRGERAMASAYYADAENGDHIDQPTPQALAALIGALNTTDNTFVTIQPDTDDPTWYASVSLLDNGTYKIEHRDTQQDEHQSITRTDHDNIADDLSTWLNN
jgi:hypothetical protein